MKLLSISAMSAVAMANDLDAMWQSAVGKASTGNALRSASGNDDRNIMDLFTLSNIFQYGCWCHFGNSKPIRGPQMDSVDTFCKTWYDSKDCVRIDAENSVPPKTCDSAIQYEDAMTDLDYPFDPAHDYNALCVTAQQAGTWADADEEQCAVDNCMIDAYFLRDIFNHMAFNNLNNTLSVSFGFDTDFYCRGITGNQLMPSTAAPATTAAGAGATTAPAGTTAVPGQTWDCCGSFPSRFPYRVNDGLRACCVAATYNTQMLECCPNGSTATIGNC